MTKNIILIGDSIFDNVPYVPKGTDVVSILRDRADVDVHIDSLAKDGAYARDILEQIKKVPTWTVADILFISAGGNDALRTAGEALDQFARKDQVGALNTINHDLRSTMQYLDLICVDAARLAKKVVLFTPYMPADGLGNDRLVRFLHGGWVFGLAQAAQVHGASVVHLAEIIGPEDLVQNIEPGQSGSNKIASIMLKEIDALT